MIINEDNINDIEGFVGRAQRNNILNLHYDLDKNETLTEKISDDKFSKYTQAIAYFKLACLKNNIIYSNAQAGCTKEIDEESERILKEKAQEIGIAVRSCILQCQHNSFKVGDNLDFYVDFTGYDPKNLEFRFFVKFENMDWRELQGYSPRRKCRWKPDRSGNYSICAYIRYNDFSLPFLDYSQMEICIS